MKTIRDYFNYLVANYSNKLAKSDIYEIFEEILKRSYVELVLDLDYKLTNEEIIKLDKAIELLNIDYPVAYITKRKFFFKKFFFVNENVLIPRNDTEVLVEHALTFLNDNYELDEAVFYDICTGSGVIGLSIKIEKSNTIAYLSDISKDALDVAKENKLLLKTGNVNFIKGDFVKPFIKDKKIPRANLIVCNPPYIVKGDINVENSVDKYEPKLALYADNNGLDFYQKMANSMYKLVDESQKFMILMEFGFEQKEQIEEIFKEKLKKDNKIEFIKDNSGNWRLLKIYN